MLCTGAPELKLPFTIEPKTPRKIEAGKKTLITLTPKNFDIIAESAATRPLKRKKAARFHLPPSLFIVKGVHNEKKTVSCYFILRAALTHLITSGKLRTF